MSNSPNKYWIHIVESAKRAIELEGVPNISYAMLEEIELKSFNIKYIFFNKPSDDDLEALSLIHTEIVSDVWSWVVDILYEWRVEPQQFMNQTMITGNLLRVA